MATLASMTVRLGIDTDRLRAGADRAKKILIGVGKAVAGLGAGVPAAAAAAVAVGGIAAAAVSAGAAYQAFAMAAGPQMEAVRKVSDLAAAAQEAAAEGGEKAATAQKAYADALGQLPKATQATAKEFIGLKRDQKAWSDSLAGTTMPVYTKGLQLMRRVLPMLTPLVKAAGGAFKGFLDDIDKRLSGGGPAKGIEAFAKTAGKNLRSFLNTGRNVAIGFGGVIKAFMPMSTQMSGGLEKGSAAFAAWGKGLSDSAGFAKFVQIAKEGGKTIGALAAAALELLVALGPLIGITTTISLQLATMINALPPGVVRALATAIGLVVIAMKLWAVWGRIVEISTRAWAVAQRILNMAFWTSPVTWIVLAIVALIVVIVLIATKTTWFQTIWRVVWNAVKIAFWATVNGILTAADWLAALPGKIAGWVAQAAAWAIKKFLGLVTWVAGLPGRVTNALASLATRLAVVAVSAILRFHNAAVAKMAGFLGYVRGVPGRIVSGLGNLGTLLVSKGRNVVEGLWSGIRSMGGWIKGQIMSWAADVIPGPIAKALGIASPSKVTKAQGQWIGRGLVEGLTGTSKQVRAAAAKLADIVSDGLAPGKKRSAALGKISAGTKQLISLANQETALAARLKTASKSLSDQIKARDKLSADVRKGVMDSANITQLVQDMPVTADALLTGLQSKVAQAQAFAADLAKLRKKGVSADLIAQIAQAGVEQGSASAQALANASSSQIKQINAQQAQLSKAATSAGNVAGDAMYGSGIDAAKGLIKGLQSQQKAIEAQMLKIAKGMQKSIRQALGIASPSKVFAKLGRYIPAGFAQGIDAGAGVVDQTMRHMVDVPALTQMRRDPAATDPPPQRLILDVTGADDDWKRMFRRMVKNDAGGDVVRFAGG